MSKLTINGPITAEGFAFNQSVLNDLQGHKWIKDAIRAGLRHDPDEACDGAALIFKCMQMRVQETEPSFDDEN